MHQIHLVFQLPGLESIVRLEFAVRRHPRLWWRIKIESLHKSSRVLISNIYSPERSQSRLQHQCNGNVLPCSVASTDIEDILSRLWNRTAEEWVLLLRVEDPVEDVRSLHRFKLFLVAWSPVFTLPHGLIPTAVLHIAGIDGRGDGVRVPAFMSMLLPGHLTCAKYE